MRCIAVYSALAGLMLSACGQELTPEERELQAARDVALVERANDTAPPLREVTPEPILYTDVEQHDLLGAGCSYAPGTSLGARVVAREADAYMKIDGEMQRFAADPGSRELPLATRSLYSGREYSLRLEITGEGEETQAGKLDYEGTISLRDAHGRIVYEGTGLAQCSG